MTSRLAYRIAAVLLAWLILHVPGFAETGEDRIYWADMDGISLSKLAEGTTQRIITDDTRRPGKLAVDVLGGKMYWVDRRSNTIQRSDMDGSDSEMLVELTGLGGGYVTAADLDLDLRRRKIYFTVYYHHGDHPSGLVCRVNLDGTNVEFLGEDLASTSGTLHWTWSTASSTGRIRKSAPFGDRIRTVPMPRIC